MARMRVLAIAAAAIAGAWAVQGCVSLSTYERQKDEIGALRKAYEAGVDAVGHWKREAEIAKSQLAARDKEIAALRQQVGNANLVVAKVQEDLKAQYERMLEELRAEGGGGGDIVIENGHLVLLDDVFFASGKAVLNTEKVAILDKVIERLASDEFARAEIEIAGHTDTDPIVKSGWQDNYQLSAERARSILKYFLTKGIDPTRLFLSGYGPTRPRSATKSENRRVEVVLHERTERN